MSRNFAKKTFNCCSDNIKVNCNIIEFYNEIDMYFNIELFFFLIYGNYKLYSINTHKKSTHTTGKTGKKYHLFLLVNLLIIRKYYLSYEMKKIKTKTHFLI